MWWSGNGFVNFVVTGVSLGEIKDFLVFGIRMEILGVQNDLSSIIGKVFYKFNDSGSMSFWFT